MGAATRLQQRPRVHLVLSLDISALLHKVVQDSWLVVQRRAVQASKPLLERNATAELPAGRGGGSICGAPACAFW
jgi:hypothetical protein